MKMKMSRYFKNNAHNKHIQHYIYHCSIGDWFVLYQMSKNLNKRYFAEFLALVAMTVDPDPTIEPEEPEINLCPEDIENIKNYSSNEGSSKKTSTEDEDESESEDDDMPKKKESVLLKLEGELDTGDGGGGGGGGGITGKQRMLIKLGKHAKSANKSAMMAAAAMKRARRK